MELQKLINIQKEFDKKHGWTLEDNNVELLLDMLNKDLIGLFGEIGEFANIIKKYNLTVNSKKGRGLLKKSLLKDNLKEELIDSFIYLFRIASHLDIDLGQEYLKKLAYNERKYKKLEIDDE